MNPKKLTVRKQRFVNNFIGTLPEDLPDYMNEANWEQDCKMYGFHDLDRYFGYFKSYIEEHGFLPEEN